MKKLTKCDFKKMAFMGIAAGTLMSTDASAAQQNFNGASASNSAQTQQHGCGGGSQQGQQQTYSQQSYVGGSQQGQQQTYSQQSYGGASQQGQQPMRMGANSNPRSQPQYQQVGQNEQVYTQWETSGMMSQKQNPDSSWGATQPAMSQSRTAIKTQANNALMPAPSGCATMNPSSGMNQNRSGQMADNGKSNTMNAPSTCTGVKPASGMNQKAVTKEPIADNSKNKNSKELPNNTGSSDNKSMK